MPKCSRKEDREKSMPMSVEIKPAAETSMALKKRVVRELIKEGKVIVKKKKDC